MATAVDAQSSTVAGAQLLLTCAAAALGTGDPCEVAPAVAAVTDWEWVVGAAERHAVTPLVQRQLAAHAAHCVPPAIANRLRAAADENAIRNLALARHLVDVLAALDDAGIQAIPLKGPVLALAAYGDLALRRFVDLDLLVRRRDLGRARALLECLGYGPLIPLARGAEAAFLEVDYHLPLVRREGGASLELHWSLASSGLGALRAGNWAWRNSRRVSLLGRDVHALSWEALLVYLCVHGSKHAWEQLSWVCDVAAVLRTAPAVDWSAVWSLARGAGARRMLALGLALARDLLHADVTAVADIRQTPVVQLLASLVEERMFCDVRPKIGELVAFQCRVRERPLDVAAYCVHVMSAPHPADLTAVSLPPRLLPLYYVLRPLRLALKRIPTRPARRPA